MNRRDVSTERVFLQYERSKDVSGLMAGLGALVGKVDRTTPGMPPPGRHPSDDDSDDEEDEEDDDDEEDEDAQLGEEDSGLVNDRLMSMVAGMRLSNLETAALRLAIARDDVNIRDALAQYKKDLDAARLAATLRQISRQTIQETLASKCPVLSLSCYCKRPQISSRLKL